MNAYIFIAMICTATSTWNGSCQAIREVRVENLTKESCEKIKSSYGQNYRTRQADCLETVKK